MQITEPIPPSPLDDADATRIELLLVPWAVGVGLYVLFLALCVSFCVSSQEASGQLPGSRPSRSGTISIIVGRRGAIMAGGAETPPEAVPSWFEHQREALRLVGVAPAAATVTLRADDVVPTGRIQETMEAGRKAGFQRFLLRPAAAGRLRLRNPQRIARTDLPRAPSSTPTIQVRLRAGADGTLTDILLDRRPLRDIDELHSEVRAIVLHDGSPQVELDCDYNLRYKYTLEAIAAVSGRRTDDAQPERLVDRLKFAPVRKP